MYDFFHFFSKGPENWKNKSFVRAIPSEQYKLWKPEVYNLSKSDYIKSFLLDESDDAGDDLNLPSLFESFQLPPIEADSTNSNYQPRTYTKTIPPPPSSLTAPFEEEEAGSSSNNNNAKMQQIKDWFKCPICMEAKFDIVFCRSCSRNVGCGLCIGRIEQCPMCRAKFEWTCTNCGHKEPLVPTSVTITGLEDSLN